MKEVAVENAHADLLPWTEDELSPLRQNHSKIALDEKQWLYFPARWGIKKKQFQGPVCPRCVRRNWACNILSKAFPAQIPWSAKITPA